LPNDAFSLRTSDSLNDVEDDFVALFETFVTIVLNRTEMDEDVIAAVLAEEAVAFDVVKPFHRAFVLTHRIHPFLKSIGYPVFARLIMRTVEAFA
jgi:hypothetical protein